MNDNVIQLGKVACDPADEGAESHITGPAFCQACRHTWTAVAPVGTVHLECPQCKRDWGTFTHAVEPYEAWACNCGEHLFWLVPAGVMCRKCGAMQTGWF